MPQKRKYTPKRLREKVEEYFASISREIVMTERKPTGELDKYGHPIYEEVPIINRLGEEMKTIEFLEPPMKTSLARYLGVHPSTYSQWEDAQRYPEYADILAKAHDICLAWRQKEVLTRSGKDIKGITFDLAVNYGVSERVEVNVTGGVEDYIRRLEEGADNA